MAEYRPDPDALLARFQREEVKSKRGKLETFLGACAGVGKTYAMLSNAREEKAPGTDIVIVETHGRSETAALAEGVERVPLREVPYKETVLREFDLDAALARKPAVMLVDELAHTNAPGSPHPKRWQDVEELLAAGINVYTTLNVQHLESLNVYRGPDHRRTRAICKAIVEAHGGTIYAENIPAGGVMFRLNLPQDEKPPSIALEIEEHTV